MCVELLREKTADIVQTIFSCDLNGTAETDGVLGGGDTSCPKSKSSHDGVKTIPTYEGLANERTAVAKEENMFYFTFRGMRSVRVAVASFLTEHFASRGMTGNDIMNGDHHFHREDHPVPSISYPMENPKPEVDPDCLALTSGSGAALDLLCHALCDVGDVILSPTPHYKRIENDFRERGGVETWPVRGMQG